MVKYVTYVESWGAPCTTIDEDLGIAALFFVKEIIGTIKELIKEDVKFKIEELSVFNPETKKLVKLPVRLAERYKITRVISAWKIVEDLGDHIFILVEVEEKGE